jgi:hypothetical protein
MSKRTATRPKVTRPSLGWFLLLDGGIVALAALATSPSMHEKASESLPVPLPPRSALRSLLAGTAVVHLAEALHASRLAKRRGLRRRGWALQTFIVGFPSLLALRKIPVR